jgi:uncharacterized membrane protein YhaH (DUF805 family)
MKWYWEVLKKYAVFSGRSRRKEFWIFGLIHTSIVFALKGVEILVLRSNPDSAIVFVQFVYLAATLVPTIAVSVRRLHDTNRSGWWYLVLLIPIVGLFALFLFAEDSEPGDNPYGPNPKGIAARNAPALDPNLF